MLLKYLDFQIQAELYIPVILSSSSWVFEQTEEVNGELFYFMTTFCKSFKKNILHDMDIACPNIN